MSPFCSAKIDFWDPRPLQNEEPATNLARGFLCKIRVPNPFFLVHISDFLNHWPLHLTKLLFGRKEIVKNTKIHFEEE